VFAQKGNDIIQLSYYDFDQTHYADIDKECFGTDRNINGFDCYKNKLATDAGLQTFAQNQANRLVTLFAIK